MSSSDNRVFTVCSTDGDFVLNARYADTVEGWKTAIQCSWDLIRKDIDLQSDDSVNDSALSQIVDMALRVRLLASSNDAVSQFLIDLSDHFSVFSCLLFHPDSPRFVLFFRFHRRCNSSLFRICSSPLPVFS